MAHLKFSFILLVFFNFLLLGLIAYIAYHYAWLDKLMLRHHQQRLLAPSYMRNPNYLLYDRLFAHNNIISPHIFLLGVSMFSIPDWFLSFVNLLLMVFISPPKVI